MFHSLVSVAISGSEEIVMGMAYLGGNTSETLLDMTIEDPGWNRFLGIRS